MAARGLRGRRLRGAESLGYAVRSAEDAGNQKLLTRLVEQVDAEISKLGHSEAIEWSEAYLLSYDKKR